jgi:hypothetical protein
VVVRVALDGLIATRRDCSGLAFWSFEAGHFIAAFERTPEALLTRLAELPRAELPLPEFDGHFHSDAFHAGQRLAERCNSAHALVFAASTLLKRNSRLTARIDDAHIVAVDPRSLLLAIIAVPDGRVVWPCVSNIFASACSIALSANRAFLALDFSFGMTRVFRVHFLDRKPIKLSHVRDFSWSGQARARSAISGVHALVASARGDRLVLWDVMSGSIHRVLSAGAKILSIAFDDAAGVWAATGREALFVSVNGKVLAHREVREKVTVVAPVAGNANAVCGTASGAIYAVHANKDRSIDARRLPSEHRHAIDRIVVHPSGRAFVSIDRDEVCVAWGFAAVKAANAAQCGICARDPVTVCPGCGWALCRECSGEGSDGKCKLCQGLEA